MFLKFEFLNIFIFLIFVNQCFSKLKNEDAHHYTKYLKANNLEEAKSKGFVDLGIDSEFESFSGYFTVDENCGSNLFSWFFKHKNKSAPVILWLGEEPGSSSLFSLFNNVGPYVIQKDLNVTIRKNAWTEEYSVLFVDSPVGAGFSYTDDEECYSKNQEMVARDLYTMLLQFFSVFRSLKNNEFYIMGNSYAGKYIPAIAHKIHLNRDKSLNYFKFSGIAIGNGFIDPINQLDHEDLLFQLGYIDEEQKGLITTTKKKAIDSIENKNWISAFENMDILQNLYQKFTGLATNFNFLKSFEDENLKYFVDYLKQNFLIEKLHVGNHTFCDGQKARLNLLEDIPQSIVHLLPEIIKNYKVLLFNGQLDLTASPVLTINFLTRSEYPELNEIMKQERKILELDNEKEIVGYIKSLNDFHFVNLRNAGHLIPYDQPKNSLFLIKNFIENKLN